MANSSSSINESDFKFLLSMFERPEFPRRYSTAITGDIQYVAESFDHALARFQEANNVDCKINLYNYLGKMYTTHAESLPVVNAMPEVPVTGGGGNSSSSSNGNGNGHHGYHYDIASCLFNASGIPVAERIDEAARLIQAKALSQQAPTILFVDLDDRKALNTTRKRIKHVFMDEELEPTVIDTGNGLHLLLGIEIDPSRYPVPMDSTTITNDLVPGRTMVSARAFALAFDNPVNVKPGNELLKCAAETLTKKHADKNNHPSVLSCMTRVPGSYNKKLKDKGIDKQVEILERGSWDYKKKGHIMFLLPYLDSYIKNKRLERIKLLVKARNKRLKREQNQVAFFQSALYVPGRRFDDRYYQNPDLIRLHYWYIEVMLRTPFDDFRKLGSTMVIAPYLIRIKKMPYDIAKTIILQWLAACDRLRYLDFDAEEKVTQALDYAKDMNYLPYELSKIAEKNPVIHAKLLRMRTLYYSHNNEKGYNYSPLPPPPAATIGGN